MNISLDGFNVHPDLIPSFVIVHNANKIQTMKAKFQIMRIEMSEVYFTHRSLSSAVIWSERMDFLMKPYYLGKYSNDPFEDQIFCFYCTLLYFSHIY